MIPPLLWLSYRRYLRQHLWLPLLSLSVIATGVAVILGTDLASISAKRSFEQSTQALTGRATHAVIGAQQTVPDEEYRRLRTEQRLRASAPVVEGHLTLELEDGSLRTLTLLGIDPFADGAVRDWTGARGGEAAPAGNGLGGSALIGSQRGVVASARAARELDWALGSSKTARVGSRQVTLELAGTFSPSSASSGGAFDGFLLSDLSTAQALLEQRGLDRVDLLLTESQAATLADSLPAGLTLTESATSQRTAQELSAAFHLSLESLSYLCLLVASFLIFNVVSFSVVHRRQSFGRLRLLGVTGRQLGSLLVGEALLLGALGSVIGVPLGLLLGRGLVPLVSQTVNDLYYQHLITDIAFPATLVLKAALCGLVATVLAAAWPARALRGAEPLSLLHLGQTHHSGRAPSFRMLAAGLVVLALSAVLLAHNSLTAGLVSLLGVVLGYSLCVPLGVWLLVWGGRRLSGRLSHRMAMVGLAVYLPRTAMAAVALTVAVAATLAISVMVGSFRQTLTQWLEHTLQADIYVSCRDKGAAHRGEAQLSSEAMAKAVVLPQVQSYSSQRAATVPSESGETVLVGVKGSDRTRNSLRFLALLDDGWSLFERGEGVFVTEPYARRLGKDVGATLTVTTRQGERPLTILGVYYSYAPDRNTAMVAHSFFEQMVGPGSPSGLGLELRAGSDVGETVSELKRIFGESAEVRATSEIKAMALEVFERTFTVTEVLRVLAVGIALIGVVLSLWALGEERRQEVGVLRALGMTNRELFVMSCLQSCWLGLAAGLLACPLGAVLSKMMISVLNRRAFGWTIDFAPSPSAMIEALVLAVVASFLAGCIPAYRWSRWGCQDGLRERE